MWFRSHQIHALRGWWLHRNRLSVQTKSASARGVVLRFQRLLKSRLYMRKRNLNHAWFRRRIFDTFGRRFEAQISYWLHRKVRKVSDRDFLDVFGRDRNLVVSADEIDFWKDSLTVQMLRKVFDMWWEVPIEYGAGIQRTIVTTWPQASILLRYAVRGWCSWDFRWPHQSLLDHHFKLRLNLFESIRCEATRFAVDGWPGVVSMWCTTPCRVFYAKSRW